MAFALKICAAMYGFIFYFSQGGVSFLFLCDALFLLVISVMPCTINKAKPPIKQRTDSSCVNPPVGNKKRITAAINSFVDNFMFIPPFGR